MHHVIDCVRDDADYDDDAVLDDYTLNDEDGTMMVMMMTMTTTTMTTMMIK